MGEVSFSADPDGLEALSQRLSSLEAGTQGLTVAVDAYAPTDLSPSGDVWNALQAFSQTWSDGLKVINGNVSALQQRLTGASTFYYRSDGTEDRRRRPAAGQPRLRWAGCPDDQAAGHHGHVGHAARPGQRDRARRQVPGARAGSWPISRSTLQGAGAARRVGWLDRPGRRRVRAVHRACSRPELGDVRDAYAAVASALRQYAGQLEPVVKLASSSLSYQAEDAEYTLAAVERARSQAIASGHNPAAAVVAWDIKIADGAPRSSPSCALRLVPAARRAERAGLRLHEADQGSRSRRRRTRACSASWKSDFERDVADPLARAAKEARPSSSWTRPSSS